MKFSAPYEIFYATSKSGAFDIQATGDVVIESGKFAMVPTGIFLDLSRANEEKEALLILPRSGLAAKHGVTVLNSPGLVDQDYPGEIKVILINHGSTPFVVNAGDRIAQGMVVNFASAYGVLVKDDKRTGGFGSTGK